MKKIIYIVIFIFATTLLYANIQIIESFTATNSNDAAYIEWKTKSEKNVARLELQRLANGSFKTIYVPTLKGPSTYKYTDSESFTKDLINDQLQSSDAATYKIKIIYSDNSPATYTDEVYVVRKISNIKRTLGMLKEMFK